MGNGVGNGAENGAGNKDFARAESEVQMQLVREQDEQLDELAIAVERIGVMGKEMHTELGQQGSMLEELEDDFDNTRGRMGEVQRRLNRFVEETGRGQLCTIAALVALFCCCRFCSLRHSGVRERPCLFSFLLGCSLQH